MHSTFSVWYILKRIHSDCTSHSGRVEGPLTRITRKSETVHSGEMERMLALRGGEAQLGAHHLAAAVVGQLQVVNTRHHTRQVLVWVQRRLQRFAHHR